MIVCFLCALFIYLSFWGGGGCFSIYMGFKCVASIMSFNRGYEFMFVDQDLPLHYKWVISFVFDTINVTFLFCRFNMLGCFYIYFLVKSVLQDE